MGRFQSSKSSIRGGATIRSAKSDKPIVKIVNRNADETPGSLRFTKNSSSPSGSVHASLGPATGVEASDVLGSIDFYGRNSNDDELRWSRIRCESMNVTDGSENASIIVTTKLQGDSGAELENARTNPMVGTTATGGWGHRRPRYILDSGTTLTLQPEHSGLIVHVADAFSSGMTITLPDDAGANGGFFCTIFIGTTQTGTLTIQTAADNDLFLGCMHSISAAAKSDAFPADGSSHDKIVLDANNKGRMAGSVIHCYLMGTDKWLVEGHLITTGTPNDPWAD
tara:strand:- start:12471 stop:13316 length:846 start_codon:yes stop_codon:yes gene_type:complete